MAEEKSKLVEEVQSTTQEVQEPAFDPSAFSAEGPVETTEETTETTEVKKENEVEDVVEDVKGLEEEAAEQPQQEDGFSWDSIETDKVEEPQAQEEDVDWDVEIKEEPKEEEQSDIDWKAVAKTLGLDENTSVDDIKQKLQPQETTQEEKVVEPEMNDNAIRLNDFLKLSDKELLAEEMKADGMAEDKIEEALDKMEDSGLLVREAHRIRRQLQSAIKQEAQQAEIQAVEQKKMQKQQAETNRKELQTYIKTMEDFMGGKVNNKDKQEAYKYIVSGNMQQDIWKSHTNASEVAMFLLFKDKFAKILRAQGLEDGKASILNKITSPSLKGKSKPTYEKKDSSVFDPAAFMRE
tara:strand:- start:206 stop:1258 length:1053 start_codon:yes stop_codon:yes gene_type:complete